VTGSDKQNIHVNSEFLTSALHQFLEGICDVYIVNIIFCAVVFCVPCKCGVVKNL